MDMYTCYDLAICGYQEDQNLKIGFLAPLAMLAQLPAMITKEDHDGGICQLEGRDNIKHPEDFVVFVFEADCFVPIQEQLSPETRI